MKIKIIKFSNFIAPPNRYFHNDSGADVFAAKDMILKAHSVDKIPLGVGLILPDGYDAVIHCKSGLSTRGIWASNAPIDAGYRGQIHAILYNTTNEDFHITEGMKVGQIVIRPVIYADFVESLGDERSDGGFGSTGI